MITKPITQMQYVVIVQKTKPPEGTMRYAVSSLYTWSLAVLLHNFEANAPHWEFTLAPTLAIHWAWETQILLFSLDVKNAKNNRFAVCVSSFTRYFGCGRGILLFQDFLGHFLTFLKFSRPRENVNFKTASEHVREHKMKEKQLLDNSKQPLFWTAETQTAKRR